MIALLSKDDDEVTFNLKQVTGISQTPQSVITHAETSPSIYQPSEVHLERTVNHAVAVEKNSIPF